MKRKTLFKRLIALGLTAVLSLPAMVAVHAEGEADTASVAPVAANLVGKTVTIDGVRGEDEGWTVEPTFKVDARGANWNPLKVWLGVDDTYLYGYMEMQHGQATGRRILQLQLDFYNRHDETDADGNALWTTESYRKMLGKEALVGTKSAWIEFDLLANSVYASRQYRDSYKDTGIGNPANNGTYLRDQKDNWKQVSNEKAMVEFKVALSDDMRAALKEGTMTIGAGAVYHWGTDNPAQYDTTYWKQVTYNSRYTNNKDEKRFIMEPALLPDVILPCTSAPVGQLLGTQAADMGETYGIRFLATTDNKTDYSAYQAVGFDFMLAGKTKKVEKTCEFVYDSVTANYGATTVSAKDHGANYIYACTIEGLAKTGTYTFTVTPWTLAKGEGAEKAYGTAYTVVYTDGAFVSATPVAAN